MNTSFVISIFEEIIQGEYHGDLVGISYRRYMRDTCEDLKGLYFVIKENGWENSGSVIMRWLSYLQGSHV